MTMSEKEWQRMIQQMITSGETRDSNGSLLNYILKYSVLFKNSKCLTKIYGQKQLPGGVL